MKSRLLVSALSVAALAATGCAYQGNGGYSHSAYPTTYSSHTAYSPYRQQYATVGGTRLELGVSAEQFVDGNLVDATGTFNDVSYDDAFKQGFRVSGGAARDISPNTSVIARGFYKTAEGEDQFNYATVGGVAVNASVSDYKSYGAELGLRQYLGANRGNQLRPFVGATVGAAFVDDINVTQGLVTSVMNESGWSPTASATGGFELPVSPTASLALESGLRWTGAQDRSAGVTAMIGEDNDRFAVPVTLRGSFRF